jgi:hypothetical protein
MIAAASIKVAGRPVARAVHLAKRVKREVDFVGLIGVPSKASATAGNFPDVKPRLPSILEAETTQEEEAEPSDYDDVSGQQVEAVHQGLPGQ